MKIHVLYNRDCPNWQGVVTRIQRVVTDLGLNESCIESVLIDTDAVARDYGFAGSPTVLVDGADLFPSNTSTGAFACRVYPTGDGLAGAPTEQHIRTAIEQLRLPWSR